MRTEKEKMLAGENYDATSPELWERWQLAKRLQSEYNNTPMTDTGRLSALLDLLLGSYGEHVWISAPFFVDYGENIHIGHHVEINMNCVFLDCNRITIGNYSGIGGPAAGPDEAPLGRVDGVLSGADVARSKPHPDCFLEAMRREGCSPRETLIFEDSAIGIEAARRSGAGYVVVRL